MEATTVRAHMELRVRTQRRPLALQFLALQFS
jgi:hypothetical protein